MGENRASPCPDVSGGEVRRSSVAVVPSSDPVYYPGSALRGDVAQLGERLNGIQEVDGSIPFVSTNF